ncbi:hypothetical protein ACFQAT_11115 [Undibacterium arcticum]|uniref:hypothetical protein n=1 Tax=Undibacterium arcticum TaxID=1762892 RepID=UPI00361E88FE
MITRLQPTSAQVRYDEGMKLATPYKLDHARAILGVLLLFFAASGLGAEFTDHRLNGGVPVLSELLETGAIAMFGVVCPWLECIGREPQAGYGGAGNCRPMHRAAGRLAHDERTRPVRYQYTGQPVAG